MRSPDITAVTADNDPDRERGLYAGELRVADLPYVRARMPVRDASGSVREWRYLLAARASGTGCVIGETELIKGTIWPRLGLDVPNDAAIGEALTYVVRRLARDLPVTELVPRWEGGQLLMPPAEVLQPAGHMLTAGTEAEARTHWAEVAQHAVRAGAENLALHLGFAAASPYLATLSAVDNQSVCVTSSGPARRGKTTNAYAAAAWFGSPTVLDPVMSESAIAIGDSLAELGCLPFFRDEIHGANWSPADWHTFFMRTLNGAGRRRSSSDGSGSVRHTRQWWGVQFLTGNIDPRFGETGGVTARVLVLTGPHLPDAKTSKRVKALIGLSYGWPFQWWLADHLSPSDFLALRTRALNDFYAVVGVQKYEAETISEALALGIAGAEVAGKMFGVEGLREAAMRAAVRVIDALVGTLDDAPGDFGEHLLQDVMDRVQAHPGLWPMRGDYEEMRAEAKNPLLDITPLPAVEGFRWRIDGRPVVSMLRSVFGAMADGVRYPTGEALTELRAAGVLVTGGDRRGLQHTIKINGAGERFYTFKLVEIGHGNDTADSGNDTGNDTPSRSDLHGNDGNDGNDAFGKQGSTGEEEPTGGTDQLKLGEIGPENEASEAGEEAGNDGGKGSDLHGNDGDDTIGAELAGPAVTVHPCARCGRPVLASRAACERPDCRPAGGAELAAQKPAQSRTARPARAAGTGASRSREAAAAKWEEARQALRSGGRVQLLEILAGPCAPRRMKKGDDGKSRMQVPYWRPELPGITDAVHLTAGFNWSRKYSGPRIVLDKSGAWLSSGASVRVAHGALMHTGEMEPTEGESLPCGDFLVRAHKWSEPDMPSPIGNPRAKEIWVPEPTAQQLRDLAAAGRWGGSRDLEILDSYTADGVRLNQGLWATGANELRSWVIDTFGRESEEYTLVKAAYGQVISLLLGVSMPGQARTFKSRIGRPDWAQAIQAHSTAMLWRRADDCRILAPDLGPVALRNVDEIVIPAEALPLVTEVGRTVGKTKSLVIDQTGRILGTFKVKAEEES